jgi:hypothetical protein
VSQDGVRAETANQHDFGEVQGDPGSGEGLGRLSAGASRGET